jgi:hypothetical protein
MRLDDIDRVREAMAILAQYISADVTALTEDELEELSYAALTIGFGTARKQTEEESQRAHDEMIQYFALEASYQAGTEISYAVRRARKAPARHELKLRRNGGKGFTT